MEVPGSSGQFNNRTIETLAKRLSGGLLRTLATRRTVVAAVTSLLCGAIGEEKGLIQQKSYSGECEKLVHIG